ncbi:SDR family oxidoreductase [Shimia sp. R11_0]|uniref:SDR family oxidoreductase n=1 Tax=Shimia sp. R11_0 TaxID=2821096 RepID=UPI001ADD3349|nr:SDR family oxidoreductase [Shimia sp. R11_0]MBO9477586.1 SDR family oxidoreductase [Shimia sp. R11_0]
MPQALVLGGYGLIGAECLSVLARAGYDVTGVGRSPQSAARFPQYRWKHLNLTDLKQSQWDALLSHADLVVNATGALQDGAKDTLTAIHVDVLKKLAQAAKHTGSRVVHISAVGADTQATTDFLRTKAQGDAILAQSGADHVILRPAMVLGRDAYGGSALLRACAALPWIMPRIFEDSPVQTVALSDVAQAVLLAANPKIPSGTVADLAESGSQSFDALALRMRQWIGLPPPILRPRLSPWMLQGAASVGDGLGWLGWRAPLRSSAITVLKEGITAAPKPWQALSGQRCATLHTTLSITPATSQDRTAARLYLLMPLAIATLAVFWVLSGTIGLLQLPEAAAVMINADTPPRLAELIVIAGAFADIALGGAILIRRHTRRAAIGMVALSAAYLLGAALLTPALFADPLGPMVKVLPGITLAAFVALLLEDR